MVLFNEYKSLSLLVCCKFVVNTCVPDHTSQQHTVWSVASAAVSSPLLLWLAGSACRTVYVRVRGSLVCAAGGVECGGRIPRRDGVNCYNYEPFREIKCKLSDNLICNTRVRLPERFAVDACSHSLVHAMCASLWSESCAHCIRTCSD